MGLILIKASRGVALVIRPQARARWRPASTTHAASVELWMRRESEPASAPFRNVGVFRPGDQVSIPHNPAMDENVTFAIRSRSVRGVPNHTYIEEAVIASLVHQRETEAPQIGQEGAATAERVTIGISGFTRFARKRRVRISANADMSGATEIVRASSDYVSRELPLDFDIDRGGVFIPDYTLKANDDPATVGWTKTGAGTVGASGGGWQIDTSSTNLQTFYTKDSFEADPFADGFTLVIPVPDISAQEVSASHGDAVAVRVRNATKQFNIAFDSADLVLNDSDVIPHGGAGVILYLVVAAGGATADLYLDGTLALEDIAAVAVASGSSFLRLGDLETTSDATAIWQGLKYQLSASVPQFPQTIYVTVAHSGGTAWTPESEVLELSFADDSGAGGTTGSFNPVRRDKVNLDDVE